MKEFSNNSPRYFVVEMSVKIEHYINSIVALILGVKFRNTKSFGNSNEALSFNAKANLLLDLEYLEKNDRIKFQIFMEIRNKFAHLYEIDTFEKCFELTRNYNKLLKIYEIDEKGNSLEEDMNYMFICLSLDITSILKAIEERILNEMSKKFTQRRFTEEVYKKNIEYFKEHPENKESVNHFIEFIKNIILNEVDEKIKNKENPHI
ncbi:hypothetical protein SAMN05443634_1112 [Chishuiella changwenlii]|uniref:Mannitol repressor n=2 Tax=Chishuiella changwenlii TaxID=1434701 RepID=A0A1M7BK97_9FLAO|nr:hypothetical protein GCM10010984_20010 [Chishuiella changwenlii]SHL54999.1 hypothetical protein SAMN05443634_1112 [Chishuiella changwenlii]